MSISEYFNKTKIKLDKISPSFCLAKWTHLGLHLHSGEGHSCHHPSPQPIPLDKILENPSALHNTPQKIEARSEMLKGLRPKECRYCWTMEDSGPQVLSDRIVKSSNIDFETEIEKLKLNPAGQFFKPKYLEVGFSNLCNLKCVYCGPHFSTAWAREQENFGPMKDYPQTSSTIGDADNPYVTAFFRWWPEIKTNLEVLRLTGGEPLLADAVIQILQDILEGPKLELKLIINSNLSVPDKRMDTVINLVSALHAKNKVSRIQIISSMESTSEVAEYMRFGISNEVFWRNIVRIRDLGFCDLSITATINVLCLGSLYEFYKKVGILKKEMNLKYGAKFFIDPSLLKEPDFLNILHFSNEIKDAFASEIERILNQADSLMLSDYEVFRLNGLRQVIDASKTESKPEVLPRLKNFLLEIDKRRNLNYQKTFKDLAPFLI